MNETPDLLDIASYDYRYPIELIANAPCEPRDHSRLMHLAAGGVCAHRYFYELPELLRPNDLLVLNETRVLKARLRAQRVPSGGAIEILVLGPAPENPQHVRVLAKPAKRMQAGQHIRVGPHDLMVIEQGKFALPPGLDLKTLLAEHGELPLPPYISPPVELDVARAYQPIFARVDGSIAAPTASLHFSEAVLAAVAARGVQTTKITLEVGLGTFAPVRGTSLRDHQMHEESYEIPAAAVSAIAHARVEGGRIVAVGTTVVRALESAIGPQGELQAQASSTRAFITPGYAFRVVDALITNFHVPKSTLLALVSAFAGHKEIMTAYALAVKQRYRLFSFGDAMFIERK